MDNANPASRFTERSRRAVTFAQQEAARLSCPWLQTAHLLWGLIKESATNERGRSVADRILERIGVDGSEILEEVEPQLGRGSITDAPRGAVKAQFTPASHRVLVRALKDAEERENGYLGSEHLLVGLLHSRGMAAAVLTRVGATFERVDAEIKEMQQLGWEAWSTKGT